MDKTWLETINQNESLEMLCFFQKFLNSGLFGIRDFAEISHNYYKLLMFFFFVVSTPVKLILRWTSIPSSMGGEGRGKGGEVGGEEKYS